jgi:Family of unknown function (DUF6459)
MPALPPDWPGASPPSGGHLAGAPGGTGPAGPSGPGDAGCPHAPARLRPPAGPRPLPDPAAIRLYRIPDSAPPYDDETAPARRPGPGRGSPGGTGVPQPPGATGPPGPPVAPPGWPSRFAQVLAETLAGSRPPRQLAPWTTERARERIRRLGPQLSAGQQPRVRRVVTFRPTADAMEMAVVVGFGQRVHALAVRLERAGGTPAAAGRAAPGDRWLCVVVEAA